eukprot:CAMPEP_0169120312 /NCGR_PEP_ID=MMETSP1015-20121227/32031_1 /TAXON_ID=342587 /ORGANISM="Karlodinium micrum, Strain CCMP2283" /LENGTH=159 /DNA_ID=CAMNT_0009183267 /DNA_START=72 /DNA_END=551 /DNA_ORIENTATION=+
MSLSLSVVMLSLCADRILAIPIVPASLHQRHAVMRREGLRDPAAPCEYSTEGVVSGGVTYCPVDIGNGHVCGGAMRPRWVSLATDVLDEHACAVLAAGSSVQSNYFVYGHGSEQGKCYIFPCTCLPDEEPEECCESATNGGSWQEERQFKTLELYATGR